MGSPEVLDFETLLAPILGDNPAGPDLREDMNPVSKYREIRTLRGEARQAERNYLYIEEDEEEMAGPPPDWKPVEQLGIEILAGESKDLEVASLLTEAVVRRHGLPGLRDSFRLLRELCEQYWDDLYPRPDEDGIVTKVAPITGLNGEDAEGLLVAPIGKTVITGGQTMDPFTVADYRFANELARMEDATARARRAAQPGAVTREMFNRAVAETSEDFVRNLADDFDQCNEEFEKLCELLEERCGKDESGYSLAPPSSNIRNALRDARQDVESIYRDILTPEEEPQPEEGGQLVETGGGGVKQVTTREDAFRALEQVAAFFRRTEPHSPVSYALEQAVRWGRMPLPDLLNELIYDHSTKEQLFRMVGMQIPEEQQ